MIRNSSLEHGLPQLELRAETEQEHLWISHYLALPPGCAPVVKVEPGRLTVTIERINHPQANPPQADDAQRSQEDRPVNYHAMNKPDLLDLAARRGVEGLTAKWTVAQITQALQDQDAAKQHAPN